MKTQLAINALNNYVLDSKVIACIPYGSGHINDTYLVVTETGKRYVFQRLNASIFKNKVAVMENITKVTNYLKEQIEKNGGNPERETLNVISSVEGLPYYEDESGFYRMYRFVEGTISKDQVSSPDDFYESALSFGNFQSMLAEFPAEELEETIPDFHNTRKRFERFCQVVAEDKCGRAHQVLKEIRFVLEHEWLASELCRLLEEGKLPLRVTHNDTKLNNIMLDEVTGKGICVIDLDTVMPGLSVNDFGDSIRFGASTAAEDETDLSKVACDMELFRVYTKGFLEGCKGRLTDEEVKALPLGAMTMTFECGMRFLTDYLEGDVYFKIHRPEHNLDRCRTQFALVEDMEKKRAEMDAIVAELAHK